MTKATANRSKRTFTIRKNGSVYRTNTLSKEQFEEAEYRTPSDWNNFLRTSQDYYFVR